MKPLIIGEAPGKHGDPTKPVEGRIGARLSACCGLSLAEFLSTFDRVNLLPEQPQDSGHGMAFDAKEARRVALKMHAAFKVNDLVILLGKRVAKAFESEHDYFEKFYRNGAVVYTVPHPSGANRWWNSWNNELKMIEFMHYLVTTHQAVGDFK